MAKLGDFFTIASGGTPDKRNPSYYENGTIPWVKTGDLKNQYVPTGIDCITEEGLNNSSAKLFPPNTVLVAMYGATIGACSILTYEAATNQACAAFLPNKNVLPTYLYYFLLSKRDQFVKDGVGGAQPNISAGYLKNVQFDLVPVRQQEVIVERLDEIENLIALRKEQLAKLDQLVKSRFIELFGATSAKNCTKQIKDYAEVLGGYAFKSDLFCADAIPVIRISNINNGCVELDYNTCFDELFWEQNKRFRVEQNDVLMAMSGATTGKAGIYRENMPALINQRVACIRAKDGVACPTFLFVATQLEWMYDLIQETSAGCAQPNISGKQIENMPVPDASYEQQQQFASFVEQTDKSKFEIQKSLEKLETLKKALMQKYFG